LLEPSTRPLGKPRGVAFVIILSIITIGIYWIYWSYANYAAMRRWRGPGRNGVLGVILNLIVVGTFLMPSYVGRMYKASLIAKGEEPILAGQKVPITGWRGFLMLIPSIERIICQAKIQSKLNNFWEGEAHTAKAAREMATAGEVAVAGA
jgi:Domain of unknown function (DUF4234)